ncbi:membrane protein PM19L-like [Fagus crenata]
MAAGRRGKDQIGPLLVVNLVVFLIVLGLAGWSLDKFINGEQNHPHLGGNSSTSFMLIFALIAGVVVHLRAWRSDSLAGAGSLATVSWAITALAFGLACNEIILGGRRGKLLQTLEAFIFISLLSQLLYLIVLHAGVFDNSYGPGYRSYANDHGGNATGHEPQNSGTSAVI